MQIEVVQHLAFSFKIYLKAMLLFSNALFNPDRNVGVHLTTLLSSTATARLCDTQLHINLENKSLRRMLREKRLCI